MAITLKDTEVLDLIDTDFQASLSYAEELSEIREEDFAAYRGAPYAPDEERKRQGWSTTVNTVVANTVNWTMPGLVEIFSDDFFRFKLEDQNFAEDLKKYIRKVWFRLQDGEKKNDSFLFDCLISQTGGYFKIYYDKRVNTQTVELEHISDEDLQAALDSGEVTSSGGEQVTDTLNGVDYVYWKDIKLIREVVEYEGPVINVPAPDEVGFSPEAKSLNDARLVWCRSIRNLDYVKRMEESGEFKKGSLKKAKKAALDVMADETKSERDSRYWLEGVSAPTDAEPDSYASSEKELEAGNAFYLYEVYTKMDIDGDGLLEDVIIWCSGNTMFGIKENPYKRLPLRRGTPFSIPHQFLQDSYPNMLKDEQKNSTMIDRLTYDAAAKSTYQNLATSDEKVFKQLKKRGPNTVFKVTQTTGQVVQDLTPKDPGQFILKAKETQQGDIENKSGVTRYNQGIDANSLNKTLGGINMIMNASQQRQKLLARRLGWTFRDVIGDIINILDKWPTPEYLELLERHGMRPGMVKSEDITIDVGVSFQEKFAMAQQLDSLIQFGVGPGLQLGMTPQNIFAALRKKYDLLGVRAEEFIPSEEQLMQQGGMGGVAPPEAGIGAGSQGGAGQQGAPAGVEAAPQEFAE